MEYVCYSCHNILNNEYSIGQLYRSECTRCNELTCTDDFRIMLDDTFICRVCYNKIYWYCNRCDIEYNYATQQPEIIIDDYGNNICLCRECVEIYRRQNIIHQYDYIPKTIFYKEENEYMNLLYFGIELELESEGQNKYNLAQNLPDFTYAKADGSLSDGFEIVSHPATYRWLLNHKKEWQKMFDCRYKGWRSFQTKTCGMHIHLSKVAFGNHHLYKFMKLFYDNPELILKISQRDSKQNLKRWSSIDLDNKRVLKRAIDKSTYNHEDRYTAVNLNRPTTVEIRIFRGTLLAESFWKNIEFVKAAYEYSYNYKLTDMTEIQFRKYIKINKKEFTNLYRFLYEDNSLKEYNEG